MSDTDKKLRPDAAQPAPCSACGGETFVVELTRCKGCENEFYTRDQSLAASRAALADSANTDESPTLRSLLGAAPDMTHGVESVEYIRQIRDDSERRSTLDAPQEPTEGEVREEKTKTPGTVHGCRCPSCRRARADTEGISVRHDIRHDKWRVRL